MASHTPRALTPKHAVPVLDRYVGQQAPVTDAGGDGDQRRRSDQIERLGRGCIHLVRVGDVADDVCTPGPVPYDHLDAGGPLAVDDSCTDAGGTADDDGRAAHRWSPVASVRG